METALNIDAHLTHAVEDASPILREVDGPCLAMMLYGSHARGDQTERSDIDVLQLVYRRRPSYRKGRLSVTVHTAEHLRLLALSGSLFTLHLRVEGRTLHDPSGALRRALSAYRQPQTYANLRDSLRTAARILDISPREFSRNPAGITCVGLYLLRTELYARCADAGRPTFSMRRVAHYLGDPGIHRLFSEQSQAMGDWRYFLQVRDKAEAYLNIEAHHEAESIETLVATKFAACPLALRLATRVLRGETTLDYEESTAVSEG